MEAFVRKFKLAVVVYVEAASATFGLIPKESKWNGAIVAPVNASEELINSFNPHKDFVSFNVQSPFIIKILTVTTYACESMVSLFII